MVYSVKHDMLARQTNADTARARFVLALKRHLTAEIRSQNGLAYKVQGEPAFRKCTGRAPETRADADEALFLSSHYQYWAALNRTSQEMMWQAVGEPIYRDRERLESLAEEMSGSSDAIGELDLDPEFEPDPVYAGVGIHLQPNSYVADDPEGKDILSGAFYEMGGRLYSMGRGMAAADSKAGSVIAHLGEIRPGWAPKRILDMGCSAGSASVPYKQTFPDAEVHAVDLGSSMLRYAHARAACMGVEVFFHQMDAGNTSFPDGYFDLVISHNLLHEISNEKRREVARETRRLLAEGGIAIHQDVDLLFRNKTVWEEAERSWDLKHNHEPFWLAYATSDFLSEIREAGFSEEESRELVLPKTAGPGGWQAFVIDTMEARPEIRASA